MRRLQAGKRDGSISSRFLLFAQLCCFSCELLFPFGLVHKPKQSGTTGLVISRAKGQ